MYTVDQLRRYFSDANIRQLSRETALHYSVLYGVLRGEVKPSYDTLLKLSQYVDQKQGVLNENR